MHIFFLRGIVNTVTNVDNFVIENSQDRQQLMIVRNQGFSYHLFRLHQLSLIAGQNPNADKNTEIVAFSQIDIDCNTLPEAQKPRIL